jgi:hypothetical protein
MAKSLPVDLRRGVCKSNTEKIQIDIRAQNPVLKRYESLLTGKLEEDNV